MHRKCYKSRYNAYFEFSSMSCNIRLLPLILETLAADLLLLFVITDFEPSNTIAPR